MKIFRPDTRNATPEQRQTFTGEVMITPVAPTGDGVSVADVFFTAGARTDWHSHQNGQLLLVTSGRGLICAEGESPQVLAPGDIAWTPAGQRHWHGSGPDSCLLHTAISLGTTSWAEPVGDAEYTTAAEQATRTDG